MADPELYRQHEEVEAFRECCDPIESLHDHILREKLATPEELEQIGRQATAEVEEAARFAEQSPPPPPEALYEDIYAQPLGEPVAGKEAR